MQTAKQSFTQQLRRDVNEMPGGIQGCCTGSGGCAYITSKHCSIPHEGPEHLQILLSVGGPGTSTVWIRKDNCAPLQDKGMLYHLMIKDYKHKKAGRWESRDGK